MHFRDPKGDHNFDNHPHTDFKLGCCFQASDLDLCCLRVVLCLRFHVLVKAQIGKKILRMLNMQNPRRQGGESLHVDHCVVEGKSLWRTVRNLPALLTLQDRPGRRNLENPRPTQTPSTQNHLESQVAWNRNNRSLYPKVAQNRFRAAQNEEPLAFQALQKAVTVACLPSPTTSSNKQKDDCCMLPVISIYGLDKESTHVIGLVVHG